VTLNYPNVSWHAEVTFNEDGTTKYIEPDSGAEDLYLNYGVWSISANQVHWDIGVGSDNYVYDGTLNTANHTMSGTHATGTWSAVEK